jgi:molybdopterin molybdotransferase/putative molybdopterin biosynthesis protein
MEFDTYTRNEALAKLFSLWKPQSKIETVPLEEAAGRISASCLRSRFTLPLYRASARDGIAVRAADFATGMPDTLHWHLGKDYVRADTGDDFVDDFDSIIQIEDVIFNEEGGFSLPENFKVIAGMHIHGSGDMIMEDELILPPGIPIRACDLATLARGGIWDVPVIQKPVVAFIPTGNELIPVRQTPKRGENIDTNSVMVRQMLIEMGAEPKMFSIVKDNPDKLEAALTEALQYADIVIINAGSSKGADDYNARLLTQKGIIVCHGVNAAPGRPLCLGVIDNKALINVPGPMLATWFGMDWCVRAAVCHALNIPVPLRPKVKATLSENAGPSRKIPENFEFLCRVELSRGDSGYEAWPVPFNRVEGKRTLGFHNGQCAITGSKGCKGNEIDVELLYGEEYFQ